MEKIDTQQLVSQTYKIAELKVKMLSNPDVWSPYSASEMLSFLKNQGYLEKLEGKSLLDLGTGSGIIGIFCGLLGASNIILSDFSLPAVQLAQENARINGLQVAGIQSDRFASFKGQKFDMIISNPPVQPWLFTNIDNPTHRNGGAAWNEAGNDGRLVLDALLIEGRNHLLPKGEMIFSSSSRHGHNRTVELLNKHWSEKWKVIFEIEHEIDSNYHQPYLPTWQFLQGMDLDLRVYQKDIHGKKYALQQDKEGKHFIITTLQWQGKTQAVKLVPEANGYYVLNAEGKQIASLPQSDARLPIIMENQPWFYAYYLIQASY